ncbi:uncharacterized protein LODBEIA_P16960 [Lodderomyces beijingensis]|uniref:Orc1-like AAA ATPase domain-containing protein n=1 Tax=Lodderomyces beijingensis TaxID=1775926 RepID=A0ABP0ZMQ9_9ASCO
MSLSREQLAQLKQEVTERDFQIDSLNAYINQEAELSSPCVLVYSFKPVGKTLTVSAFLETLGVRNTIVRCDECVSRQMLLSRCFASIRDDCGCAEDGSAFVPALSDGFSALLTALEEMFKSNKYSKHHVLVLDRFDQCFENCDSMLPAISRFRECSKVQNLSVVIIFSGAIPREVVTYSNPNVYFPEYDEDQVVRILQRARLCSFEFEVGGGSYEVDFYNRYVRVVVDTFFDYVGSDVTMHSDLILKFWDRFIKPVQDGRYCIHEFVKLYKEQVEIFTTRDDLISNSNVREYGAEEEEEEEEFGGEVEDGDGDGDEDKIFGQEEVENSRYGSVQDLPLHSKFILLASYLASHGNPRNDLHKYSKIKVMKYKKRASKKTRSNDIDSRLLNANYVDLERILAILSVIYQHSAPSLNQSDKQDLLYLDDAVLELELQKEQEKSKFTLTRNIDLNYQIATLFSLGFLNKTQTSDILAARVRWRCNLDWSTAEAIAKSVNFPIADFLADE